MRWSRLSFLVMLLWALVFVPTTWAQAKLDSTPNPCKEMFDNPPLRGFPKGQFIYNGADNLAASPQKTLKLDSQFIGPYKAGCVIFEVTFKQSGAKIKLTSQREVSQQPTRMTSMMAPYSQAALKTLISIGNFNILPKKPDPNVSYLIAIPLWHGHAFYNENKAVGVIDIDMNKMGYPDAELVASSGETRVFYLYTKHNQDFFIVFKRYDSNEPLLEIVETKQRDSYDRPVLRYGTKAMDEFNAFIAPHTRAQGGLIAAEVRYYAIGEDFSYPKIPSIAPKVIHPKTWKPVSPPVAVGTFQAPRQNGQRKWVAGSTRDGVKPIQLSTLDELRDAYEKENIPEEEKRQKLMAEFEQKRAQYTKETMPEHLLTQEERQQKARANRLANAKQQTGFVYKSDSFWAKKTSFYIPQKTFEGHFSSFQIRQQFPAHFLTFLTLYSERCASYIKDPVTDISRWDEVTYKGYTEISRIPRETKISVDRRFWNKYLEYKKLGGAQGIGEVMQMMWNHAKASQHGVSTQILSDLGNMIKREVGLMADWASFFNEASCGSATMFQMKENLLRAANGQQSLQSEGKQVAGAKADSDPAIINQKDMTFFDGCHDYFLYEKRDFCSCMASSAEQHLTQDERKHYAKNFTLYADEVMGDKLPPAPSDPYWRLSKPKRACTR